MTNTQAPAQTVTDDQICDALQAENVYPYPSIVKAIRNLLSAQSQPTQALSDDQVREWAQRHDLNHTMADLHAISSDARSIHLLTRKQS